MTQLNEIREAILSDELRAVAGFDVPKKLPRDDRARRRGEMFRRRAEP
jgi:hypothetical protein